MKFRQRLLLVLLLICSALFIISCGKKGDPTLKTFEKPMPAKEIIEAHHEDTKGKGYPSKELEVNLESFVPSKPVNLTYVPSAKKVYLIWDKNPETWVKGYRIYRKRESEVEFKLIGESILPVFIDNEPLSLKAIYYVTAVGPKKEGMPSDSVIVHPLAEP